MAQVRIGSLPPRMGDINNPTTPATFVHSCPTCPRDFSSELGLQQHHSRTHGESLTKVRTACSYCGEELVAERHRFEKYERLFCDSGCKDDWLTSAFTGEQNPNYRGSIIEVVCDWCDETYSTREDQHEQSNNHFCSRSCYGSWRSENLVGENHHQWVGYVDVVCTNCDDDTTVKKSCYEKYERHFCDRSCMGEWLSEEYSGDGHPGWEGGKFPYGEGWDEPKREAVRERDGFKCQHCGMTQDYHFDKYGSKLHVHHIIPARWFDEAEERNAMGNLVSLCHPHHNMYETMPGLRPDNRTQTGPKTT